MSNHANFQSIHQSPILEITEKYWTTIQFFKIVTFEQWHIIPKMLISTSSHVNYQPSIT